jgi:signal peptidase I
MDSQQDIENKDAGLFYFDTSGYSMWPFLKQGSRVIAKKASLADLAIGDIVLYKSTGNGLICHRVVRKLKNNNERVIYVRGDNSSSLPEIISESRLLGKVEGIVKNNKKVIILNSIKWRIINRLIVMISPLVVMVNKIAKPIYKNV